MKFMPIRLFMKIIITSSQAKSAEDLVEDDKL